MRNLIYTLIILSTVWFTGCREGRLEGEVPGKEVALTFSGRASNMSIEALTEEVNKLHLLIFDENGTLAQRKKFDGLAGVAPVKLALGKYTFAYLSNIDEAQIGGISEGTTLDGVTVSLQKDADGGIVLPGSIFVGKDEITVGEDQNSNAELTRLVGRMDIHVTGLKGGVELKGITLLGSPETVRFDGSAVGNSVRLEIPVSEQEELVKGEVIAFPTCDSLARLEFLVEVNGEVQTYVSELKNKVEANKVHTINAKVNVSGGLVNVTIEMVVEPWGETVKEDLTVNKREYVDSLEIKVLMEQGANFDIRDVKWFDLRFATGIDGENYFSVHGGILDPSNTMVVRGDTLVMKCRNDQFVLGNYFLNSVSLKDSLNTELYALPTPVKNIIIDSTGRVVIVLPKMKDVAPGDLQAMLDLRTAMRAAGLDMDYFWKGDNLNLWEYIDLNENGRVIGIGYPEWEDFLEDYGKLDKATTAQKNAKMLRSSNERLPSWRLPESFKNLTALKYFNIAEDRYGSLAEIPSSIKDMTSLEEFVVVTDATSIPELSSSLVYLNVSSTTLTSIPSHIGDLPNLEGLVFSVPYENYDEEIGDYFPILSISRIASVDMDFSKLTKLKYLYLVAMPTCTLPTSVWNSTGNIVELALAGFSKVQIPASGTDFTSLREFSVANENMVPSDIEAVAKADLVHLRLYSPVFGKNGLPDWMGQIGTLEYITLDSCGITSIPESFGRLTNLSDLYLPRNPDLTGQLPSGLLEMYTAGNLYVSAHESRNFSPDGIILNLDKELISVPAEGGKYTFKVHSNAEWSCEIPDAWDGAFVRVTFAEESGSTRDTITNGSGVLKGKGDAVLQVFVDANNPINFGAGSRYGRIRLYTGRHVQEVSINQLDVMKPVVSVSEHFFSVRSGDTFVFDVTSNTRWDVNVKTVSGEGSISTDTWGDRGNGRVTCTLETQQESTYKIELRDIYGDIAAEITVFGSPASGEILRDSTNMK